MEHHSAFALLRLRGWRALGAWTAAATLLSGAGLLSARSAEAAVTLQPSGLAVTDLQLLAQAEITILGFENSNFAVRVFQQNGQTLMNVFRKADSQTVLSRQPATFRGNSGPGNQYSSYESFGSYDGQPASFEARVDAVNNTLLEIYNSQSRTLIRQEFGSNPPAPTVALPADQRPGGGTMPNAATTRLAFDTLQYATRVFVDESDGILKMNVYDRVSNRDVLNGAAASAVTNPAPPYERYVSYVANGAYQGISVQFYTRISSSGQTVLEIVDTGGRTLLSQPGTGAVTIDIPESDLPPGVGDTPAVNANLDPFIAAVFGNEATLDQLQALYSSFTPGTTNLLQQPQFESAPQGRFINAGSFSDRNEAAAVVNYLRSQGYDARLIFRDFNYR